jgi:hypothetical protein
MSVFQITPLLRRRPPHRLREKESVPWSRSLLSTGFWVFGIFGIFAFVDLGTSDIAVFGGLDFGILVFGDFENLGFGGFHVFWFSGFWNI